MPIATRWFHRVVAPAVLALLLAPSPALAQRDQFLAAVIRLYQALPGVFGDEGPQLTAHVEAMSAALARWEDTISENERQLRPQAQDGNRRRPSRPTRSWRPCTWNAIASTPRSGSSMPTSPSIPHEPGSTVSGDWSFRQ
jgi:hypothetical protein